MVTFMLHRDVTCRTLKLFITRKSHLASEMLKNLKKRRYLGCIRTDVSSRRLTAIRECVPQLSKALRHYCRPKKAMVI